MSHLERETLREESERMAGKRFLAGGLLALLCGLCTLAFGASAIGGGGAVASSLLTVLIIGGVPTAAGVTLFCIGLGIYREGRRRPYPKGVFD